MAPLERHVKTKQQASEKTMVAPGGWYMFLYLQAMLSSNVKVFQHYWLHKHPKQGGGFKDYKLLFWIFRWNPPMWLGTISIPRPKARRKCGELRSPNCQNVMMRQPFATGAEFDMFSRDSKRKCVLVWGVGTSRATAVGFVFLWHFGHDDDSRPRASHLMNACLQSLHTVKL